MADSRTYPHGVPSWIETEQPDPGAARTFYGQLFGWAFEDRPGGYTIARLAGREVAGILPGSTGTWATYVAVDNADTTAERVRASGGRVVREPEDAGPAGRSALCADPQGATFGLWQAGRRLGAQATNEPGAWNFSNLHTSDPAAATAFYPSVFGWAMADVGFGTMIRVPGYGDHLAATVDPTIHERQAGMNAPPGFADAVGWLVPESTGRPPHWHVVFTVADRDASVATAERLGGKVEATDDSQWTRTALVRDPWGATFTASQFTPPE